MSLDLGFGKMIAFLSTSALQGGVRVFIYYKDWIVCIKWDLWTSIEVLAFSVDIYYSLFPSV